MREEKIVTAPLLSGWVRDHTEEKLDPQRDYYLAGVAKGYTRQEDCNMQIILVNQADCSRTETTVMIETQYGEGVKLIMDAIHNGKRFKLHVEVSDG